MNEGALANLDDNAAIDQLAQGKLLKEIGADFGVSKVAVYKRLRKHPDYKDAIALQAHSFVEDAMSDLRDATADTVNIARARADGAFKYARAHSPDYADKQEITHELGQSFESLLETISAQRLAKSAKDQRVIDVTPDYVKSE